MLQDFNAQFSNLRLSHNCVALGLAFEVSPGNIHQNNELLLWHSDYIKLQFQDIQMLQYHLFEN